MVSCATENCVLSARPTSLQFYRENRELRSEGHVSKQTFNFHSFSPPPIECDRSVSGKLEEVVRMYKVSLVALILQRPDAASARSRAPLLHERATIRMRP